MTLSLELYKRFLLKFNKNDSHEGINILNSDFVLIFNVQAPKWLKGEIRKASGNTDINRIQDFLVLDFPGEIVSNKEGVCKVSLPPDYFQYSSSYSIADKDNCKGKKIYNYDKKAGNINPIRQDDSSSPQFDYEETPCILSQNKLSVFFTDFSIEKVFITYWRLPVKIDIEGYQKFDGTPSTTINSDISDDNLDEILDMCVLEAIREFTDTENFPFAEDRLNKKP